MKNLTRIFLSLALFLTLRHEGFGPYALPERETYQQRTIDKKTGLERSHLQGNFEKACQWLR